MRHSAIRIQICFLSMLLATVAPSIGSKAVDAKPAQTPAFTEELSDAEAAVPDSGLKPDQADSQPDGDAVDTTPQDTAAPDDGGSVPQPPTTEELEQAQQILGDGSEANTSVGANGADVDAAANDALIIKEDSDIAQPEVGGRPTLDPASPTSSEIQESKPTAGSVRPVVIARRPYIGVIGGSKSARISQVKPRSAAFLAGIQVGDVIRKVNESAVADFDELLAQIGRFQPGDAIDIEVERAGSSVTLFVILGVLK